MGLTRRKFLKWVPAAVSLGVVACASPTLAPTPTRTSAPTPTPTPPPPPDIALTQDSAVNAQSILQRVDLLEDFASGKRQSLRIGTDSDIYRLSLVQLPNPGPVLMIQEEGTAGAQKLLLLQDNSFVLAGQQQEEGRGQVELPDLRDLLEEARRRFLKGDDFSEILKKIAQEELVKIGVTAAAIALSGWLLAKLGAAALAGFAAIAAIVLVLALAVAGAGAVKALLEEAGIEVEDILEFLREGLAQIRDALERAIDALQAL